MKWEVKVVMPSSKIRTILSTLLYSSIEILVLNSLGHLFPLKVSKYMIVILHVKKMKFIKLMI
jgi:hypothetical protein